MIRLFTFRGTSNAISCGKEGTGSLWHDVAIEEHKISSLDTPNQMGIKGEVLGNYI